MQSHLKKIHSTIRLELSQSVRSTGSVSGTRGPPIETLPIIVSVFTFEKPIKEECVERNSHKIKRLSNPEKMRKTDTKK
jgi:hypothetical protein